ncbi:hypothetical protein OH76DRAFT_1406568 [Lentinus brumalis]|uniref:Uncharacterized protein n=1 Tax=Lentinus brumalis TaxID=2498619 RepID=A0A371D2I0_9APHY|nr:hypothetical protein OH76DRAFT_1406568 [Polyporus brumalis]
MCPAWGPAAYRFSVSSCLCEHEGDSFMFIGKPLLDYDDRLGPGVAMVPGVSTSCAKLRFTNYL